MDCLDKISELKMFPGTILMTFYKSRFSWFIKNMKVWLVEALLIVLHMVKRNPESFCVWRVSSLEKTWSAQTHRTCEPAWKSFHQQKFTGQQTYPSSSDQCHQHCGNSFSKGLKVTCICLNEKKEKKSCMIEVVSDSMLSVSFTWSLKIESILKKGN